MNFLSHKNDKSESGEGSVVQVSRQEATPRSRVDETPEAFIIKIELPGVAESAIDLTLEDQTLSVTAENAPASYPDHELVLNEIPAVRYRASFGLPARVKGTDIKAALKQGVLTLTLPKQEEAKSQRIAISAE